MISDQNMPQIAGAAFLAKSCEAFPDTVRIMLTGNNDQETAIRAVNEGQVFRFLNKPCNAHDLLAAVQDAHKHHLVITSEKKVLEETLTGSVKLLSEMLSLAYPEAFRRSQLVQKWAGIAIRAFGMKDAWALRIGAMLWPIADTLLPPELAERRNCGEKLSDDEMKLLLETKLEASRMLGAIPRLEPVSRLILLSSRQTQIALGEPNTPAQARLLHILIDLSRAIDPGHPEQLSIGFETLSQGDFGYDVAMLAALPGVLANTSESGHGSRVMKIMACELKPGDLLMNDLRDHSGKLLLATGQEITSTLAATIARMHANGLALSMVRAVRNVQEVAA